jgi:hypothetical protein
MHGSEKGRSLYPLAATENDLNLLLSDTLQKGGKPVSVSSLHFACHGEVDPSNHRYNHRYNGIVLSEKAIRLSPNIVSGSKTLLKWLL